MTIEKLCELVDKNKNELFELLSSLIKINSENFGEYGNEKEIACVVHKKCQELGLDSEMFSPIDIPDFKNSEDYLEGRNLEERYCVSAKLKGKTDVDELMLMAHLDTIEIGDEANWNFDPLGGEIRDGKIFGRGACDDKYAIATVLFLIKLLKDNGFEPKKNLVFSAYSDEEHGGSHGAMACCMKNQCNRIVNIDGRNQVWHCASGGGSFLFRFHAENPLDSAEKTALAIPVVIGEISKFAENRRNELEQNKFYKGTIIPSTSLRYNHVKAGNNGVDMGVGEIKFTYYTDKTKDVIYSELKEVHENICKVLKPLGFVGDGFLPATRFFHYGYCEPDCDEITEFLSSCKQATGMDVKVCGSCLSDLSVILKYGCKSAFAYGAGRDFSLNGGAHQKNEFIECESLVNLAKNIGAYILNVLS